MKKLFQLLAMLTLASTILVGCGSTAPVEKVDASKSNTTPVAAKGPEIFKVGDSFKSSDMQFTINGVRTAAKGSNEYMKPTEGNKWVYVDVTVANIGDKQGLVSSMLMFNLKGKDGTKFNWTIADGAKGSVDGNLVVGGKIKGELTYEVPIAVNEFDFEVQGSMTGQVAVVSIATI